MPSLERQRTLARAKLERQLARKAATVRKRRRIYASIGSVVALALIAGLTAFLVNKYGDKDEVAETASPVCGYTDAARDQTAIKDVGKPSTENIPYSGTRTATLNTNFGKIAIELDQKAAPCTTHSFLYLVNKGFYDNTECHRLTTSGIFVLQCGDPKGDGTGGPSYQFGTENLPSQAQQPAYAVGSVAMARSDKPNSNGSQFFIIYQDSPGLGPDYSLFGKVSSGLDVVTKKIVPNGITEETPGSGDGKPKQPVKIEKVTD